MLDHIQSLLTQFSQGDKRTDFCKLETAVCQQNNCTITGTVLDEATAIKAREALQTQFPTITFDLENVEILSQNPPKIMHVGTNGTAVKSAPSWGSETMSELLNGWELELLMERDGWAFTRQTDGYLGWVYQPYLTETAVSLPTHMLYTPVTLLRARPAADAELVGRVFGGTAVLVTNKREGWLQLHLAGGLSGWIWRGDAQPLNAMPTSSAVQRQSIAANAHKLIGIPYLWGGGTAHGLDCSGFSQLLYRLVGVTIPRDADMQFDLGAPVERPLKTGDLLYFGGSKDGHRSISHVGVSLGGWKMIHASRSRNGVYIDDVQAVSWLKEFYAGARTFL